MDKKRELFHKLSNLLNNISIQAGAAKEDMKGIHVLDTEQKEKTNNIIESLAKIEDNVLNVVAALEEIRTLLKSKSESS